MKDQTTIDKTKIIEERRLINMDTNENKKIKNSTFYSID